WPEAVANSSSLTWPTSGAVLDGFPETMEPRDVVALLSCVGFSSPPCWLRPFAVLSTGQQFRATLARLLAEALNERHGMPHDAGVTAGGLVATSVAPRVPSQPVVIDEFTSVVDRTVAQVGSHALAKAVRQHGLRFVAVTCHEDVADWLQPDWEYRPAEQRF